MPIPITALPVAIKVLWKSRLYLEAYVGASHGPILGACGHQAHRKASRDADSVLIFRIVKKDIHALPHNSITPRTEFTGAGTRYGAGAFILTTASTLVTLHGAAWRDAHGELFLLPSDGVEASAAHEHTFFVFPGKVARVGLVISRRIASHVEKEGFVAAKKVTPRGTTAASDAPASRKRTTWATTRTFGSISTTEPLWAGTFRSITETGFTSTTETLGAGLSRGAEQGKQGSGGGKLLDETVHDVVFSAGEKQAKAELVRTRTRRK
jgi:hypothetical protein